jgi:5'-3' exonuclease
MILIDYNAVAISSVVTQKLDVDENLIRHMILNSIRMYRAKFHKKYGEIVICTDGKRNWRYDVFPNYKFKRKDARKESKMDWNELFRITNMVLEEIKENFPYKVIEHKRCEADDIIATIVESTQESARACCDCFF